MESWNYNPCIDTKEGQEQKPNKRVKKSLQKDAEKNKEIPLSSLCRITEEWKTAFARLRCRTLPHLKKNYPSQIVISFYIFIYRSVCLCVCMMHYVCI